MGARGVSAGVMRRNDRLSALRALVPPEAAIVAVDLAEEQQAVVITDHDSKVVGRRMFMEDPWCAPRILTWARPIAQEAGFTSVVLACEPTGYRWKPLLQHAEAEGIALVCVNPMLVARGRESEDFTRNRADYHDAVIIARLTSELRCFEPYQPQGQYSRLRHLGARRNQLLTRRGAARHALRDLLACAWPTVLACARNPLESLTFRAAMSVSADPMVIASMSPDGLTQAVRAHLPAWGGTRLNHRILRNIDTAAHAPGGVLKEQTALCERAQFATHDWLRETHEVAEVEQRMTGLLDELGYTHLIESFPGLSLVGAAAILAEMGDPNRFTHPRALVKHAGLCPRANESGTFQGRTHISGRGRPALRTATWRAIWGLLPHNEVYARRYHHLRTRTSNPLNDGQARTALAGSLLRQLHVMLTTHQVWNADIAGGKQRMRKAA